MTGGLVHDLLDAAAARRPGAPAFTLGPDTQTYAELDLASRRLARWLRERGLSHGDRLVIALAGHRYAPALIYAASRAGVVFTAVHDQVKGDVLAHVLDDCEPAMVVSDQPGWPEAAGERGIPVVDPATLVLAAEDDGGAGTASRADRPLAVDPVCLIYTSGSTAMPKAVVSTHQQVMCAAHAIQSRLRYRPEDVVFTALPLSFDYGLYQLFLGTLASAHVWWAAPEEAGAALLARLNRAAATVLPAVPGLAQNLARLLRRRSGQVPPLRLLTNTGAAMPPGTLAELRAAIPGLRVQLMYGLTECKRVTIMPPDGDLDRPGSCGTPLPGTEVLVVGENGEPLRAGEIGELVIRGPHVMSGYWRRPEATAARFVRREGLFPELHTGDYGRLDADGYLYFVGRRDDLYKSRGFRVSAVEVEAAACRVPGVVRSAVLPPTTDRTEAVLFAETALSPEDVLRGLRGQLEDFKVPAACRVLDRLPLNGNGKTDRRALAALPLEAADAR